MALKNYDECILNAINEYEKSIVKIILLCVDNLEFSLGENKLMQILKGTQTTFITEWSLQKNKSFSLLKQFSKSEIKYILDILNETDYLRKKAIKNGLAFVYVVGMNGYKLLEDNVPLEISFIDAITNSEFIEFDKTEQSYYDKLRNLRYKIAQEDDVPAYCICNELSLRKMTKQLPTTNEELLQIKGIGPSFIKKYSSKFIKEIMQFKESINA